MNESPEPTVLINLVRNYQKDSHFYNNEDALKSPTKSHNHSSTFETPFFSRPSTAKKNLNFQNPLLKSDNEINSLKRKSIVLEADKISRDSVVSMLNHKITNLQAESKKLVIEHEAELEKLTLENKQLKSQVNCLQDKLKLQESSSRDVKDQYNCKLEELEVIKSRHHRKFLMSIDKLSNGSKEEKEDLEIKLKNIELEAECLKLNNNLLLVQEQLNHSQSKVESLLAQLDELLVKDKEIFKLKSELTEKNIELQKLKYELDCRSQCNMDSVTESKLRKLCNMENEMEKLEYRNKMLSLEYDKVMLLEEKNQFLESKVVSLMDRVRDYITLEEKCEFLSQEVMKWENVGKSLNLSSSESNHDVLGCSMNPQILLQYIGNLQRQSLVDFQAAKENQSKMKNLEDKIRDLTKSSDELMSASNFANEELKLIKQQSKVLELKLLRAEKERDSYWTVLSSYEKSDPVDGNSLQKILMSHLHNFNKELEKLNMNVPSTTHPVSQPISSQGVKILHMRDNPYSKYNKLQGQELICLKNENRILKERINILESGQNEDLSMIVQQRLTSTDSRVNEELKLKIESLEKKNDSLIKSFKESGKEFREIVQAILGYKIDKKGKGYKALSMYAESEENYLLFESLQNGSINLLETPFVKERRVQHLVMEHVQKNGSIPCFMSSVTNMLFSEQSFIS